MSCELRKSIGATKRPVLFSARQVHIMSLTASLILNRCSTISMHGSHGGNDLSSRFFRDFSG